MLLHAESYQIVLQEIAQRTTKEFDSFWHVKALSLHPKSIAIAV